MNMVWLGLADAGVSGGQFIELGNARNLLGAILVVYYEITDEAIGRLEELMKEIL